jgi:glucokinase
VGLTIGVDVGGTKIAAGVVDELGRVVRSVRCPTPADSALAVESAIVDLVTTLGREHPVEALGVGAAALVDASRSRVVFAANIGWEDEPLGERLAGRTGLPTVIENDANAATWAEYRFGAGRGWDDLTLVVIGTGVGGGSLVGGALVRGAHGAAGEIGHVQVVADGRACGCGQRGCLEQYASGTALLRSARRRAAADPRAAATMLTLGDGTVAGIDGPHVDAAARRGDLLATEVFREVGDRLGHGLAQLSAVLDPGCFLLGGGVAEAGDLLLEPTRRSYLRSLVAGRHRRPAEIRCASLGNAAGLIGAADLARSRAVVRPHSE